MHYTVTDGMMMGQEVPGIVFHSCELGISFLLKGMEMAPARFKHATSFIAAPT